MESAQSTESKLRVALFCSAIDSNAMLSNWKLLCEWLGCYEYILPADRKNLDQTLLTKVFMYEEYFMTPSKLFRIWLLFDIAHTNLTANEQYEVAKWISMPI